MGCGAGKQAGNTPLEFGTKVVVGSSPVASSTGTGTILDARDEKREHIKRNQAFQAKLAFLSSTPLFKPLPRHDYPKLVAAFEAVEFEDGEVIIRQGDVGGDFFVIRSGLAAVYRSTARSGSKGRGSRHSSLGFQRVASLKEGDYFGENALLHSTQRNATVVAESRVKAFKLTRENFESHKLMDKLKFPIRQAVCSRAKGTIRRQLPGLKTPEERKHIAECLRSNANLQAVVCLSEGIVEQMIDAMWREEVPSGKELITRGDSEASYFYVVQQGQFSFSTDEEHGSQSEGRGGEPSCGDGRNYMSEAMSLTSASASDGKASGDESAERVGPMRSGSICRAGTKHVDGGSGSSFGELALLHCAPRAATVTALEDSVVWVMDRTTFKDILMRPSEERIMEYEKHLQKVELFALCLANERVALARALQEVAFVEGELLTEEGERGSGLLLLLEGSVNITVGGERLRSATACEARGVIEVFGEGSLCQGEGGLCESTAVVTSKAAKVVVLDRSSCEAILGPVIQSLNGTRVREGKVPPLALQKAAVRIEKKDLEFVGLLGCGGFGVVELHKDKHSDTTYALKKLNKGYVVKSKQIHNVVNEKNILMMTNSKFIIALYTTYNTPTTVEFLLEPALGGELYTVYHRKRLFGKTTCAKFYLAGVFFAFLHLHERHVIYRDLKPENVLLTHTGHVKLADMGLAKFVIGKSYTTCGTPEYFAPEMICCQGHSKAVDWWAWGVFMFELLYGCTPFTASSPMGIYKRVREGIAKVTFPDTKLRLRAEAEDLIKEMLRPRPEERLAVRCGGPRNVTKHDFYRYFDWHAMRDLTLQPPFDPKVTSSTDTDNFITVLPEDMPKPVDYVDDGSGWDREFEA